MEIMMTINGLEYQKKPEIPSLTGLRFIAALLVCSAHVIPYIIPGLDPVFSRLSASGMTLFFVLSGFVIYYNYSGSIKNDRSKGMYNFFISRFAEL
jgi:peptidoglycan/LPS O-acetylase OafA/YrhL